MKRLFTYLHQFYQNHEEWLDMTTSCLVATILGIILTFGATFLQERNEQKQKTHHLIVDALSDLRLRESKMRRDSVFFASAVSVIEEIQMNEEMGMSEYQEDLVRDTLIYHLAGKMRYYVPIRDNLLIETLFSSSEEIFTLIDDYEVAVQLRSCYAIFDTYRKLREHLSQDLTNQFLPQYECLCKRYPSSYSEVINHLNQMPEYHAFLNRIKDIDVMISKTLPIVTNLRLELMEKTGITEKELLSSKPVIVTNNR